MHSVRTILVGVDFGTASARAVTLAGQLAAGFGARLTAIHAETLEAPAYFTHAQLSALEEQVKAARHHAEDEVRRFVASLTDVPASVAIVDRPAVEAILDAARDADLVVVGTHGRRGPARWWLGSVAERVVREATVPVLVVHGAEAAGDGTTTPAGILLASGADAGPYARRWADALAAVWHTSVVDGPAVHQCEAAHMQDAGALVVPVPPKQGHRAVHEAAVTLARTCSRPVLFVPVA